MTATPVLQLSSFYTVVFRNPHTGECRTVTVALDADEERSVLHHHQHPDPGRPANLIAEAFALRRAHREVPFGFHHLSISPIAVH